jgi:uncharacterized protein (DUF2267 family)
MHIHSPFLFLSGMIIVIFKGSAFFLYLQGSCRMEDIDTPQDGIGVAAWERAGGIDMSTTGLEVFDTTLEKTHIWLNEVMAEMGWEHERRRAYQALRSVLHALRDRLTVEEAVGLGAQLPMLIRGFYYEGWTLSGKPVKERHKGEFFAHIEHDFRNDERPIDAERMVRAVFRVLSRRITEGEIADIKGILPAELRELWPT